MTAKEELAKIKRLDTIIQQKKEEAAKLKDIVIKLSSAASYGRARASANADKIKITVAKIADLENEINADIDHYISQRHQIISQIQSLSDSRHIQILYKKYIEGKKIGQIADEMNYSAIHIKRLYHAALNCYQMIQEDSPK